MNPKTYLAAKVKGAASIVKHAGDTVLISMPGGYDQETGEPVGTKEIGMQRKDVDAMRAAAAMDVETAEAALATAQEMLAAFDAVLAEIDELK